MVLLGLPLERRARTSGSHCGLVGAVLLGAWRDGHTPWRGRSLGPHSPGTPGAADLAADSLGNMHALATARAGAFHTGKLQLGMGRRLWLVELHLRRCAPPVAQHSGYIYDVGPGHADGAGDLPSVFFMSRRVWRHVALERCRRELCLP